MNNNKNLKNTIYLVFLLTFSTLSFGADFRDLNLKIGNISLGDDLSQHLSSYQIEQGKKGTEDWYNNLKEPNKFPSVIIKNHPVINKKYRGVLFNIMEIEGKSIIHNIKFKEPLQYSVCKKKAKKMTEKLIKKFPNLGRRSDEIKHSADPSGESIVIYDELEDNKKNRLGVYCYDFTDKLTRTKDWKDGLEFGVYSKDFNDWLNGE